MRKLFIVLLLIASITQANPYLQGVADTIYPFVERDSSTNYSLYLTVDTAAMTMQVYSPGTMTGTLGAGRFYPFKSSAGTFYGVYYYLASANEMNHNKIAFEAHSTTANKVFNDPICIAPIPGNYALASTAVSSSDLTATRIHALDSMSALSHPSVAQTITAPATMATAATQTQILSAAVQCSTNTVTLVGRVPASVALAANLQADSILITKLQDSTKITGALIQHLKLTTDTVHWGAIRALRIDNYISSRQPKK